MSKVTREEVERWDKALRCAKYDTVADMLSALLDENERLKLTLTDERSLYADLAEKNERLKKQFQSLANYIIKYHPHQIADKEKIHKCAIRVMERQAAVVEAARELVASEQTKLKHARASQRLINLEKALAKLDGGKP